MKNLFVLLSFYSFAILMLFTSCAKENTLENLEAVTARSFTSSNIEALVQLDNYDAASVRSYANHLYTVKKQGNKFISKDILSLGDPTTNINLQAAMLFVESYEKEELDWSDEELIYVSLEDEKRLDDRLYPDGENATSRGLFCSKRYMMAGNGNCKTNWWGTTKCDIYYKKICFWHTQHVDAFCNFSTNKRRRNIDLINCN